MRVEYDHYSKQCPSYPTPPIHPVDQEDLMDRIRGSLEVVQDKARREEEERRKEKARIEAEQRAAR